MLRDLRRRGMRAPVLAVGDGALGFWAALRDVFPETERAALLGAQGRQRPQRPAEVGPARRAQGAGRDPRRRGPRPRRGGHQGLRATSTGRSGRRRWPRSSTTPTSCSSFFDFPAEHWIHLKTTNPIESTFATVRLRTKVTKGPGSRAAGLAMAFKLIEAAQDRWRSVNAPHLVALVRAGAKFDKGVMVERPTSRTRRSPRNSTEKSHPQVLTISPDRR